MPRPRPPYLQREVHRHGNVKWYVRIRPKPRIRIHGEYGSPEFMTAYRNAINGVENPVASSSLVSRYFKNNLWHAFPRSERIGAETSEINGSVVD